MPDARRLTRGDLFVLLVLVGTTFAIALPILRGGYLTYLDNPVHIAEVFELSRPNTGWSELGFAGFPLPTLHSPIFYPALAGLVRLGVPLPPVYAALLLVGFLSPALAIYWVSRPHAGPAPAGLLAYLTLTQPSVVWGIGSPLGGMWTMGIASAALILLAALLARPALGRAQHFAIAALATFAVLTHLFVLPLIALLVLVTTVMHHRAGVLSKQELLARGGAFFVAALASAKYWLPLVWVSEVTAAPQQALTPLELSYRLLLPADSIYLIGHRISESLRRDLHLVDALPALLLVTLGIVGFLRLRRPAHPAGELERLVQMGFWFASAVAITLLVHGYVPLGFLGPVSWRLTDWIRIGLTFSALGVVSSPKTRSLLSANTVRAAFVAVLGTLLGYFWGTPLRNDIPPESLSHDVEQARSLWTWLEANAKPEWGRVYLQDTFGVDWHNGGMALSHLLALTSHHTGLKQLGTYYGIVPYKLRWTLSEFDGLFSTGQPGRDWILEAMSKTNAGVLVTSNGGMSERVANTGSFDQLYAVSRYAVWRLHGAADRPVSELSPTNHVSNIDFRTGELQFDLKADYPRSRVLAKVAYHPWWRLEGVGGGAWVRESPEGFLVIDDIPAGEFHVRLTYVQSSLPGGVSAVGLVMLAAWAAVLVRNRRALGTLPA